MGMTMTQKILAKKAGVSHVVPGQLIYAKLDMVLANDITAPVSINEFEGAGLCKVFDKTKISLVMDHFTPNKDIKAAEQVKQTREFAKKHEIANFFDVGDMGIEHELLPEKGLVKAGDCIIGADSHTCTYGALGAFATGVGSTDVAAAMATGEAWFKVPSAIKLNLTGTLAKNVSGKDVILHIIGMIGVDGALYQSLEYSHNTLTMDDRLCIANMAIECGAKNGIFSVDAATREFMKRAGVRSFEVLEADPDAEYERTIHIDLSQVRPTIAFPHLPSNTKTICEIDPIAIDQVVIGSCTNGRYSDMETTAAILKGNKVKCRTIIIPSTQKIYLQAIRNGLVDIFIESGAVFSTPTCGPCLGGHMGVLAAGERAVATTNRNFVGRMGHKQSEVYLASPYIAASVAVKGYLGRDIV